MANQKALGKILKQGVESWNRWRKANPWYWNSRLCSGERFYRKDLTEEPNATIGRLTLGAGLHSAKGLRGSDFSEADSLRCRISVGADLSGSRFSYERLWALHRLISWRLISQHRRGWPSERPTFSRVKPQRQPSSLASGLAKLIASDARSGVHQSSAALTLSERSISRRADLVNTRLTDKAEGVWLLGLRDFSVWEVEGEFERTIQSDLVITDIA